MKELTRNHRISRGLGIRPTGFIVGLLVGVLCLLMVAVGPVRSASVPGQHELPVANISSDSLVFMRNGDWYSHLWRRLKKAEESIQVAMYVWSSSDHVMVQRMIRILKERVEDGVRVRVILDGSLDDNWKTSAKLIDNDVRVRMWNRPGSMHSKFAVIDGSAVYTGSANWSISAFYRDEETTIYLESKPLARAFMVRFESIWGLSI